MNATLTKTPPPGDFAYVSALRTGWHAELHLLLRQKRPVNYDFFPLRQPPEDILEQVRQQGFEHLILENDRWQHFFIPPAGAIQPAAPGQITSTRGAS